MHLLLLAFVQAAVAGCPADAATLQADIAAALKAHNSKDWPTFEKQVAAVHEDIGCLGEAVDVQTASRLHQMAALYFAHHGDLDNTRDAMRGALSLDGSYTPDPALIADNALLGQAHEAAVAKGLGEHQDLPEGSWTVDGRPDVGRFGTERATLVQRIDEHQDAQSWYVFGGQVPVALLPEDQQPQGPADAGGISSRPLLYGGLAGLALAAGTLTYAELSWVSKASGDLTEDEMEKLYARTHGASLGGVAIGVAGTGLVASAFIVGRW